MSYWGREAVEHKAWKPGDRCTCGEILRIDLEETGGCSGHSGEGDYCYCDAKDMHVEVRCPSYDRRKKHVSTFWATGLTDKDAVVRWIENGGPEAEKPLDGEAGR